MRYLLRLALTISAGVLFADCGGSQPLIGAPGTTPQSRVIATKTQRGVSCPSSYVECITLRYGSPFEQAWCVLPGSGFPSLGFTKAKCKKFRSGTFQWSSKVLRVGTGRHVGTIAASFDPNYGNPTELTIAEKLKRHSSGGKIVYRVGLQACQVISNNWYCSEPDRIGISTATRNSKG